MMTTTHKAICVVGVVIIVFATGRRVDERKDPEVAAISAIRAFVSAESEYAASAGHYASAECLITAATCPSPRGGPFLQPDIFRRTEAQGYRLEFHEGYSATRSHNSGLDSFAVVAVPVKSGNAAPTFCGDATGRVYVVPPNTV